MMLVSIITPSFNQAAYLETTICSVLEQDYPQIEYIVVDGGSTDGSLEIIKRHADKLTWWISEKDSGQAEAINKGFARARGEIVAWLNSDDYYLPGAVGAAVNAFVQNPGALMIYGNMLAVDEYGRTINLLKYHQLSLEDLLCFQIIGQPAVFIRRISMGYTGTLDTSFHYLLDHHLWIRIASQGTILHVPQIWAAARYHPSAKNRAQAAGFGREAFRVLDYAAKDEKLVPTVRGVAKRALASAHRVDARYLLDAGESLLALKAWWRALWIHPPTALARFNLLGSAILNMIGLGKLRQYLILHRRVRLSRDR
jgi:glycosyltransferase involved in cell wall biosynthesis